MFQGVGSFSPYWFARKCRRSLLGCLEWGLLSNRGGGGSIQALEKDLRCAGTREAAARGRGGSSEIQTRRPFDRT
jgi:hypothetical protein